jgi:excisionase family DNA binding protein
MTGDEMLTYRDAAAKLGLKIGTIYSMVARREIPHVRLGPRLVRFSRVALDTWLGERSVIATCGRSART